jgi:hypothetical protein
VGSRELCLSHATSWLCASGLQKDIPLLMLRPLLALRRGTSEWSAAQITEAWAVADRLGLIGPAMEQPQYHMLERQKVLAHSSHHGCDLPALVRNLSPRCMLQGCLAGMLRRQVMCVKPEVLLKHER